MYRFHVHKTLPEWRLVIRGDAFPTDTEPSQWDFTRERSGNDTNPDVRLLADSQGWCLFKIGGTFDEIDLEISRRMKHH